MPRLTRIDTGDVIGNITDAQLEALVEILEDERDEDDYHIDRDTLELLSDNDLDPEVIVKLEKALGDDDSMDIGWGEEGKDEDE
ncbi:MAG TPA: hypothetical protein VFP84_10255 [Kofleriaceae bacterium]|nr:hypothetical protein [Kofleriaceae bacterium]